MVKKITKCLTAFLLTVACCFSVVSCTVDGGNNDNDVILKKDIPLVENGETDFVIVLSDEATDYEKYAAEELVLYMQEATNATFPVYTDKEMGISDGGKLDETQKIISIGKTALFTQSGLKVDQSVIKEEGYIMETLGNVVVLCGGSDYGTLFSVYEFLKQQIEWEPYAVDEIYYKKSINVNLLDFSVKDSPAIDTRYGGWYAAVNDPYFAAKWRAYAGRGSMLFSEEKWFQFHPLAILMSPATYGSDHEDWYSRDGAQTQPCLTSEGYKAQLVENIKTLLLENKPLQYVPLMLNDVPDVSVSTMCTCKDCSNEIEKYTKTGLFVRWINDITARMLAWKEEIGLEKEIYFPMAAYYDIYSPPVVVNEKGEFEPIDESCVLNAHSPVMFCPIGARNEYPWMDEGYNSDTKSDLEGWLVCSEAFIPYFYTDNFFRLCEWTDNIATATANYRLAAELNSVYIFNDASNGAMQGCAFQQMIGYVTTKLEWDPMLDTNELINNFITHYYREASEEVRDYYYLLKTHAQIARDNVEITSKKTTRTNETHWMNSGLMNQCVELLRKGIAKIEAADYYSANEKAKYLQRVELELLTPLIYICDYCDDDYSTATYLAYVDEVEELVSKYGLGNIVPGTKHIPNEEVYARWRGYKAS